MGESLDLSGITPRTDILYVCDPSSLFSSHLGHLCFGESDESPPVLNSPLMMLSNSPLLLFFWPLAVAQRTRCCERKTH